MANVKITGSVNIKLIEQRVKTDPQNRPGRDGAVTKLIEDIPESVMTKAEALRRIYAAGEIIATGINPLPLAETLPATSVAGTTATLNGYVSGGSKTAVVTFNYWKNSTPETVLSATATGSPLAASSPPTQTAVSKGVTGLTAETAYTFRSKVVTEYGTVYGAGLLFTTTA